MTTCLTNAQLSPDENLENTQCFSNAVYEAIDDVTSADNAEVEVTNQ